ncbi:actin domain-containing protein [Ditylenchus destructor]|nr:actin domain-containing protein [Ditylenchus destructor]
MDSFSHKDGISKETIDSLDESILNTKNACVETEQQLEIEEADEEARNALIFQLQKQRLDYARLHVKKVALLRKLVDSDADQVTFSPHHRGQHTFTNHAESSTNVWPDKRGTSQRTTTYSVKVRRVSGEEQIQQSDELRTETEPESDPFKAPIRGIDTDQSTSYEDIPASTRYTQPSNICDTLENALSFFQRSTTNAPKSSSPGRTSPFDHLEETNIGTKVDEVILLGSGPDGPSASSTLERKERIIDQRQIVDQQVHFIHEHIKSYRLETVLSLAEAQLLSELGGLQVAKELGKMASTKTLSTDLDVFKPITPLQPNETSILWNTTDLGVGKLGGGMLHTSSDTEEDSGIKACQPKYGAEKQEEGMSYLTESKDPEAEYPSLVSQKIVTRADLLSEQNEQLLQTKISPTPKPRSRTPVKDISRVQEEDTSKGDSPLDTALFKEESIREGQLDTTQIERLNELREEPEIVAHPISKEPPANFESAQTSLVKHPEEHLGEEPDKISSGSAETVVTVSEQSVVKLESCPVAHSLRDTLAEVTRIYPEEEIGTYDEGEPESASKDVREGKQIKTEDEGFKELLEVEPVVKPKDLAPTPTVALKSAIEEEIIDMPEEASAISIQEEKIRGMPKSEKTGRIRKMAEEMERKSEKGMLKEPKGKQADTGKTKAMAGKFEDTIQLQRPEILKRSKDVKTTPLEFTTEQPGKESLEALPEKQERMEEIISDEIATIASDNEEKESTKTDKPDTSLEISGLDKEDTTEESLELLKEIAEPDTYLQEGLHETSKIPETVHMEQDEDNSEDLSVLSLEEEIQAKQLSALQKYKIKNREKYEAEQEEKPIKFSEMLEAEKIKQSTVQFDHSSTQMLQKEHGIVTGLLETEIVPERFHLLGQLEETAHFKKTAEKIDAKFKEPKSEIREFTPEIIQEKQAEEMFDIAPESKPSEMEALELENRKIQTPFERPMSVEDSEIITILEGESQMMRQKFDEHHKIEDVDIRRHMADEPSSNIEDTEAVKLQRSGEQSTTMLSGTFTEIPLTSDPSQPPPLQLLLYITDLEDKPLSAIQKYHLAQHAANAEKSTADEPKRGQEELGRIRKMAKEIQEAAQNIEQEKPVPGSEKDSEVETRIRETQARQAVGKGRETSRTVHGVGKIKNIAEKMETLAQAASGQYEVLRRQRDLKSLPMVFEQTQERQVQDRSTLLTGSSEEAFEIEPVGKPEPSQKHGQSSQSLDREEFDFEDVKDMEEELKTLEVTEDSSSSHYSSDEPMLPEELDNLVQSIVSTSKSPASRTKSAPVQKERSTIAKQRTGDTKVEQSSESKAHDEKLPPLTRSEVPAQITSESASTDQSEVKSKPMLQVLEEQSLKVTYEIEEISDKKRLKRLPTTEPKEEQSYEDQTLDESSQTQSEVHENVLEKEEPADKPEEMARILEEESLKMTSEIEEISNTKKIKKTPKVPPEEEQGYEDLIVEQSAPTDNEIHEVNETEGGSRSIINSEFEKRESTLKLEKDTAETLQLLLFLKDLAYVPLSPLQKYHLEAFEKKIREVDKEEKQKQKVLAQKEMGKIRQMTDHLEAKIECIKEGTQDKDKGESSEEGTGRIRQMAEEIQKKQLTESVSQAKDGSSIEWKKSEESGKIKALAGKFQDIVQLQQYEVLKRSKELRKMPIVFTRAHNNEPAPSTSEYELAEKMPQEEVVQTSKEIESSSANVTESAEEQAQTKSLAQSEISTFDMGSENMLEKQESASNQPIEVTSKLHIEAVPQEVESLDTEVMTAENERNILKEFEESQIKLTYELEESTEHIRVRRTPTGEIIEETLIGPDNDSHLEVQNEQVELPDESESHDESLNILSRSVELTQQPLSNLQKFRLHRNIEKAGVSPPSPLGAETSKNDNVGRIKQMAEKVETKIQAMTGHYDVLKRTRDLKRTPLEIQMDAELVQSKISSETSLTDTMHEIPTSELFETEVVPSRTYPPLEALQTSQVEVELFSERTDESMEAKLPVSQPGIWKTAEKVPIESEWERPPSRKSSAHMLGRLLSDIQEREDEDEQSLKRPESKLSTLSEVVILHWLEPEPDMEYEPLEIMQPLQAIPQYVNKKFKLNDEEKPVDSQTALSRSGGIVQRLVEEYDETGIETVVGFVLESDLDYENKHANAEDKLSPLSDSKEEQGEIEPNVTSPAEPSSHGFTPEYEIQDTELKTAERSHTAQRMSETVREKSYDVINVMAPEGFQNLADITLSEGKADISYVTEEIPVYDSSMVQATLGSDEDKKETATGEVLAKETEVETQTFGTREIDTAILPEISRNTPNLPISQEEGPSEDELFRVDSRQLHYEEIFSQDLSTEFIPELAAELPSRKSTIGEADDEYHVENLEKEPELHSRNMTITFSSQIPLHPDLVEGASVLSLALETEEERNRKAVRDNLANEMKEGDTFVMHGLCRTLDLLPSILEIVPESQQRVDVRREQPYISTPVSTRDDHELEASQEIPTEPASFTTKTTATFVIRDKAKVDSIPMPDGSDTQLFEQNVLAADEQISVPGTSKASEIAPALITRRSFRRSVGVQANPLYSQVGMQTESGQSRTTNIGTQSEVGSVDHIWAMQHSRAGDSRSSVDLEIHTEPFTTPLGAQAELRSYADASLQTDGYLTGIDDEHQLLHLHEELRPLNECPSLKMPVDSADYMAQADMIQPALGNVIDIEIHKVLREQMSSSAVQTPPILMTEAKETEAHPQEHPSQKQQRQKERTISESELERVRETLEAIRNIIHSPISDQQPPIVVDPQRRPLETLAEVQERSSQSLEIDFSSESESYGHKTVEAKSSSEVEHDTEPAQHCDILLKSADLEWLPVIPPRRTVDDNEKFLKDLEKAGIALDVSQHPNYKEVIEEELKAILHRPTDNFQMTPERGEEFELVADRETDEELLDGNENEASTDIAHYFETKSLETPTVPQTTETEYPPEPLYRIDEEERSENSEERPKSISLDQKSDKSNEPHIPIANIQDYAESAEQTELIPGIHGKGQETREYTNTAIDTCKAPVKPRRSADLLLERSQEIEEEPISVISSESKLGHDFREDQLRIIKYTLDAVNRHLQKDEITPEEPAEIVEEADLDLYYQDSVNLTDKRHPLDSGEFGLRMESRSPSLRLSPTNDNERLLQDIREARRLLGKGMREAKTHKSSITVSHQEADHLSIETKERNRPMPLDFTTSNIVKDYDVIHEQFQLQPPPFSMRRPSLPEYRPPSPVVLMDLNNIPLLSPTSMHFHIFDQYLQQHNWQMPYFLVPKEHELLGHCKWPLIERVIPSFLEAAAEILMRSAHLATDRVIVIQTIDKTGRRSDFPRKFSKASEEVLSPPVPGSDYTVTQFQFTDPSDRPIRPKKRFNLYYEVDESFIPEKDEDELEQWHKLYRERDEPIRSIKNEGPYADDLETETDLDENASVGSEEDSIIPKDSEALWTQPIKEKRSLADELKYIIIRSEPSENKSLRQYPEIIPETFLIKEAEKPSEYEYEFPIELDEPRKEESENKVNLPEVAFNPNEARFVIFRRSKRAKDPKYSMIESVPQKDTPEKDNQRRSPRHVLQETKIQTLPAQLVKLKPPAQITKPPSPVDHRSETAIELAGVLARRLKRLEDIEHEKLQKGAQILPRQVPNTTDPPKAQRVSFHQPKEVESAETKKMSPFGGRKSFLKSGKLLQISDSFDDFDETMLSGRSEQSKQTSMHSEDYVQREKALEKRKPEDNTSQTDPSVASLPSRQPKAPSTQPEINFAHSHIQTLNPVSELESSRPTLKSVQLRQKPAKRKRKPEDSGAFNSDSESEQEDKYVRKASKLFRHLDKEYLSQKEKFAESGPKLYTIRFARPPILSIVGNRKHYIAMPELYDGLHNTNGTQSDNFGLNGKDESDQTRQWDPTTLLSTKLYKVDYNPLVEKRNRFRTMEGHLEVPNDETNIVPEIENAWKRLYFRTKDGRFQWFANHCADEHPTEDVLLTGTTITANKDEWTLEVKGGKENANITVRAPSNLFEKWRQALLSNSHSTIIDAYVQPVYPPVPHYTHKVVLIELGTCSVRAGILTNKPSLPQTFFPAVGCVTAAGEVFVGIDAFKPDIRSQGVLQSPIQTAEHQNLVERYKLNKVVLEACLRKVLTDLRVDPSQYKVLLSVPQNIPTVFICDLIRSLLRELRFKAASIARQPSLILYSYDVTTGVVVDIGERLNIVPVIDEYIVESAIISLPFGAQQIRDSLKKNLRERNSGTICSFSSAVEQIFLRHIMEQSCYVATDFEEEVKKASDVETTVSFDKFNIGSGMDSKFTVDASRFHATEGLFKPKRWGLEMKGIHQLIHDAIQQSPIDSRRTLYRNIYLTGGTSLLPGLAERLETELAKIAPSSIFVQVHGSPWRYHSGYLGSQIIANSFQFENCCADLNNLDEYIGQLEKSIN